MAAVEDLRRRFGVGWGGIVLYLALALGGFGLAELLGSVPTGDLGRQLPVQTLVPAVVFGFGLLGVVLAASNLPTYLRLARSSAAGTGDAADASGRVVLRGTADTFEGTLSTPCDGTEAVAYTTRVLKNSHDDAEEARDSEKNWSAVRVGEEATRFAVDDGSGAVTVDPDGARLYLQGSNEQFFESGSDLPAGVREYLAAAGVDVDASDAHLRVGETTLEPGEEAFVVGRAEGGLVDATLVAEGDHAARIRGRVVAGGGIGAVVAAVGYLGLLWVSGVV